MKRSGKILLEGTVEEFKKHCKGADNREYLLINTKEIKKDGTYTVYQLNNNTERITSISAKGKYGKKPFIPYDKLYLTFIVLNSGTFVWTGNTLGNASNCAISYSTDNGDTWSEPASAIVINVNSGDKVMWKGNMIPSTLGSDTMRGVGSFKLSTAFFDVQGNAKSLLYGDKFKNSALKELAFTWLFKQTNVVNAKNLILSEASTYCYYNMFNGCTNLETAPLLPAPVLLPFCYSSMFRGCEKLNYIKMLATSVNGNGCLSNWVDGVAETGTMVVNGIDLPIGVDGVPSGWTVQDIHDYSLDYLTFVATSDGTFVFEGSTNEESTSNISYSTDNGVTWSEPSNNVTVNVTTGDKVLWRGKDMVVGPPPPPWGGANVGIGTFLGGTASFDIQGNIMSLIYEDNFVENETLSIERVFVSLFRSTNCINAKNLVLPKTVSAQAYNMLFYNCLNLITPPLLPAEVLENACYSSMFSGCTSLEVSPQLPATTLANSCYSSMFRNCTSLTTVSSLSAVTLASECCWSMFEGCTSLITVPNLIAPTIVQGCYYLMFYGCTSLVSAPQILATSMEPSSHSNFGSCQSMFANCTSLTTAPELPITTLDTLCYNGMFANCTSLTQTPELPATTLSYGCYLGMFQGCTSLTIAPQLQATTLTQQCYNNMFKNCTSLNYIKMLATDISASHCLDNWVSNVANSGTFVKAASMITLPNGASGIPTGWTVEDATE